ncbi:MAG: ATP-dependent DNA helicase [Clostridia bacterium]|nr:ATP-dependent DNA helicase [Clostridia bacterium]
MPEERISVRALVEFTYRGEDIVPTGSVRDMLEGTLGHKARQSLLGGGWEAEVPLKLSVPLEEGNSLLIAGRMDAFRDGTPPCVEEIKLWQENRPPVAPEAAHRAQAVVYGHILCATRGLENVTVRVVYVTREGGERGVFTEELTADGCAAVFEPLLRAWLKRRSLIRDHELRRNASLRDLRFPFAAWRPGQREMAAQVYTAIRRGRRLFAAMPTGTGKSAAAVFPALKALADGSTGQVFYLTARTTQRQGPRDAVSRMREQGLCLWVLTLDAKDRQCPEEGICHPDFCPRAKGHYLRDAAALEEMLRTGDWTPEAVRDMADRHCLCPFELSLSLCELADLVICDYNYALDPAAHIRRVFDRPGAVTLLIDEAHNLPDRVRDMLSGSVDAAALRRLRTAVGKQTGRTHPLYKSMTRLIGALAELPVPDGAGEGLLPEPPRTVIEAAEQLLDTWAGSRDARLRVSGLAETMGDVLGFARSARGGEGDPRAIWQGPPTRRTLTLQAMTVAGYFAAMTRQARGTVCFSATLYPLEETGRLLGCEEEDACFAAPSPFPPGNLLVVRQAVNTRYGVRETTAGEVAKAIETMVRAHPGRYLAFFPSYAYLTMVAGMLSVPFRAQDRSMGIPEREDFLAPFRERREPCLGLCVLGGVFAEGIDLPGDALDGVAVVGVGLPQVGIFRDTLRDWYEGHGQPGFLYAYQIPGMQKVAQAVGRVIRTETDRGVALLLDDRYSRRGYEALCPPHWQIRDGDPAALLEAFWNGGEET